MNRRTQRVGNLIRNTVGNILLTKLSDPRIDPARTSITRVEVPEDLLTARVYVSIAGTKAEQRNAMRALGHAAGHIQELMMREISLRNTPVLEFVHDENFQKTLQTLQLIEEAMNEIRQKEREQNPGQEQTEPHTVDTEQDI